MVQIPSFNGALDVTPTADSSYVVQLSPDWTVGGKPNGGYLMSILARCAGLAIAAAGQHHPHCVISATSFIGSPDPTEATVEVEILRRGLGATQVRAVLRQGGGALVDSSMTFSTLKQDPERLYDALPAIQLPPMAECVRIPASSDERFTVRVMDGTTILMDPATMDWSQGLSGGLAELRGWASFTDDQPIDEVALLYLIDCFPPATFPLSSKGWVPTIQLTAYVRALPAPGPVRIRQKAQVIEGGFVDEVCEIWDETGVLVAQGTQLAKVRF